MLNRNMQRASVFVCADVPGTQKSIAYALYHVLSTQMYEICIHQNTETERGRDGESTCSE